MGRILIADDEEMDRMFNASVLEEAGHQVLFAQDGETALATWQKQNVDLVITDLVMPQLNGMRLIRAILDQSPGARIIAISGVAPEQLDLAQDLGAMRTLFKPIPPETLLKTVEEVLGNTRRRDDDPWVKAR